VGQTIAFTTTGALPTGVVAGQTYYVISAGLGASAFEFSATPGGAAVNTTGSQSGTHTGCAAGGGAQTNFLAPLFTLAAFTGSITTTTLTVASTQSGTVAVQSGGAAIYGNGVAAGTILVSGTGPFTISPSQTVAASTKMILIAQNSENAANGAAPGDWQVYTAEELFVDGVRYTRIGAAATPVAPGAGQWYWDFSNNSVNINLASPTSHTIEFGQVGPIVSAGSGSAYTLSNLTWEKVACAVHGGAMQFFPDGSITAFNCIGRFNKGAAINGAGIGSIMVSGGSYTDNGSNGIIGSPSKGFIIGATVARNNYTGQWSAFWNASGIKFTGAEDSVVANCQVYDNGGPGIWNDISAMRNTITDNNVYRNSGPGIFDEISAFARIYNNTITQNGSNGFGLFGGGSGVYVSNSNGVEVYNNIITVGPGTDRAGGGICMANEPRGSSGVIGGCSFTGSISGNTLTVAATLTGTVSLNNYVYGIQVLPNTYIIAQLTGTTGSTGTYRLNFNHPTITSVPMVTAAPMNNILFESRNNSVHHNTITYLSVLGAMDSFFLDQAIVGGSNNYRDYNTYYTPNSTGTFWYHGTDAAVNTSYTWAAYQAAGFELHSTNIVGIAPSAPPPTYPNPRFPKSGGSTTVSPLSISTVTTGGVAVTAIVANGRNAGGWIKNPESATVYLGINEIGTASGTSSNGNTTFIAPGTTYYLSPSANAVSVISADSGHIFSGLGLT
jgi:parallel beta-helix repeat protein